MQVAQQAFDQAVETALTALGRDRDVAYLVGQGLLFSDDGIVAQTQAAATAATVALRAAREQRAIAQRAVGPAAADGQ